MSLQERLRLEAQPLFLMDGSAFIYRSFFASRNLQRSDGFPTNALFVISRILLRILKEEKPRYFVFIRDGSKTNFRHTIYPEYKANREAMPDTLVMQLDPIKRMVQALGLPYLETQGFEADDYIASLTARFAPERPVIIIGGDKDLKQCLAQNVYIWDPDWRHETILDVQTFQEENGLKPHVWPDLQALVGDAVDNIPGVPGIGLSTARKIFAFYTSLEDIQARPEQLPKKLRDKLTQYLPKAFIWRQLARLATDCCPDWTLENLSTEAVRFAECNALIKEFELKSLHKEIIALQHLQQSTDLLSATLSFVSKVQEVTHPTIKSLDDLPKCQDKVVALLPTVQKNTFYVAVADQDETQKDYFWTGDLKNLANWVSQAQLVVVADWKALLRASPVWRDLQAVFDLGLAAYLLNPAENDYSWFRLRTHWAASLPSASEEEAHTALALAQILAKQLASEGLQELYHNLEMPLVPVLAKMEARGIAIDTLAFQDFLADVQKELDGLTQEVFTLAGCTFNLRSAQQIGDVLFNKLGLPCPHKTKGGQFSTKQEDLEKLSLQSPVAEKLLRFRKLEKMRSTYLAPLPKLIDRQGRLHTTFNQKGTATGRLSSHDPNLQNIPVRGALGKRMRRCFVARPGYLLLSADYSQIELRVLAHIAQDQVLLEAFRAGKDIHTHTASLIYNLPRTRITAEQRRTAKTINFGLIYGMGALKLSQELKISLVEAKEFIANYFVHLTGLKKFYEEAKEDARKNGYVMTLGGRRRLLPEINAVNGQVRNLAERQAINTIIQGSAADIIKLAMLAVDRDQELETMGAQLLLQIHDELVFEVPEATANEAGARVAVLMSSVKPCGQALSVDLAVDLQIGQSWE